MRFAAVGQGTRTGAPARWVVALAVLGVLAGAPARAVPSSLRSAQDVVDLTEAFLASIVASDVKGAYRLAAQYWPLSPPEVAKRIEEAEARRLELRRTLGLSLGSALHARESAGDRVLRVTQLERFDKGAVVWRFVFYRADRSWALVELTDTSDLSVLFAAP